MNNNISGQNTPPSIPVMPSNGEYVNVPIANVNLNVPKQKKDPKIFIVIILVIILTIFVGLDINVFLKSRSGLVSTTGVTNPPRKVEEKRTFMIYMVGSDLESSNGFASYDLDDITTSNVNLEENNIVVMLGGTNRWNKYGDPTKTKILEYNGSSFVEKQSYDVMNMGSSDTLSIFLNYVYNNYPTSKYDLIFWNHGCGASAFQSDEISKDYLTTGELATALSLSPFKNEKIESTIFIDCMSATIHFASAMAPYSEYMVATEEISWASQYLNKLDVFGEIKKEDTGLEIGKKFIDNLNLTINRYSDLKQYATYSVIDLSKIDNLEKSLNDFVAKINNKKNYDTLLSARSTTAQYGVDEESFDLVDIKNYIEKIKHLASAEANRVIASLNAAIKYNQATNTYSNGLSIYIPYKGDARTISIYNKMIDEHKKNTYSTFFGTLKTNSVKGFASSLSKDSKIGAISGNSLVLSEDAKSSYVNGGFKAFTQNYKGETFLTYSTDTTLEGYNLKNNYFNKVIRVDEKEITIFRASNNARSQLFAYGNIYENENDDLSKPNVKIFFNIDGDLLKISQIKLYNEGLPTTGIVDLDRVKLLAFGVYRYDLIKEDGTVNKAFESDLKYEVVKVDKNNHKIEQKLPYATKGIYSITDKNNNIYYSDVYDIN